MPQSTDNQMTARQGESDQYLMLVLNMLQEQNPNLTDKDLRDPIIKPGFLHIYPLFLIPYYLLTIFGIISNSCIIYYVIRHKLYRDITHAFLVNLSLCHIVQCGIVLPVTLMIIIIQNWIFGQFLCYFLPLLQDIPLHVAITTHLLIAWDRMRWLGDPLKGRLPSFVCCCATWLAGMVIALPFSIYTTYIDLGLYQAKFHGVGFCLANLLDDMHEYIKGLFFSMYCAPSILLVYLYIRTSRELRPPEGPLGVMMFEHRAELRCKQRHSSSGSSSSQRPPTLTSSRTNYSRSYDLYDAEMDVNREKRTQRHLASMAAIQIVLLCPLMVLRTARMILNETFDNTFYLDITYLIFIWIGFLPTIINPCIYASWVLSRSAKERLRGYFRLSSRRVSDKKEIHHQRSSDNSITQDVTTTETFDDGKPSIIDPKGKTNLSKMNKLSTSDPSQKQHNIIITTLVASKTPTTKLATISTPSSIETNINDIQHPLDDRQVNNSCSNITSSTYCNVGDSETDSTIGTGYYDKKQQILDRDSLSSVMECQMNRRDSSSTMERDMDIIDLLERERSMDIQDMIERERRAEKMLTITKQNASFERHRKLPDISKICTSSPNSPKGNVPNYVFTHQQTISNLTLTTTQSPPVTISVSTNVNVVSSPMFGGTVQHHQQQQSVVTPIEPNPGQIIPVGMVNGSRYRNRKSGSAHNNNSESISSLCKQTIADIGLSNEMDPYGIIMGGTTICQPEQRFRETRHRSSTSSKGSIRSRRSNDRRIRDSLFSDDL